MRWRLGKHTSCHILQADIQHSVIQSPAHEKLKTKVVDTLGIGRSLALLCFVPLGNEAVTESQAGGRVGRAFVAVEQASGEGCLDMANHLLFEPILVGEAFDLVLLPSFALRFGDGSYQTGRQSASRDWLGV